MISHPLLDSYISHTNDYDEYVDSSGTIRPIWTRIIDRLRNLSPEEFSRRDNLLQRLIADNGITYNVYSENGKSRQWNMDLLPLVFSSQEWKKLENGLRQRAELINQSLKDLYGPQNLLKEVAIPPYLVYANPAFLRPCYGIEPVGGDFINLYSADIARSPNGNWWILNDRIEAASGMGYVLENRLLSSRLFPEFFRDGHIERLNPFYDDFQHSVSGLNPSKDPDARIALLTPGPANETYFEQSFLAKNLGFQLVEGADLTVRDNQLFFKTLKAMYPIRTLLRRLDSDWCDPLELRNESLLGIPGLLNCLRSGKLGMVNMLGTGLMETVALPAFMEGICHFFRGEDLQLPSVATWWCGQRKEFKYVSENLNNLVIKRTFRHRFDKAIFGPDLSPQEIEALRMQIAQSPEDYCAQEIVSRATAPAYHDGELQPHHFLIRVYLTKVNGEFKMMQGGLARIAPTSEATTVSMQHGAISKDVWIIQNPDDTPIELIGSKYTPLRRPEPIADDISSRTANNMYWFGRYIERMEGLARQLRIIIMTLTEDFHEETLSSLRAFLAMLMSDDELEKFRTCSTKASKVAYLDDILTKYVSDASYISSLESGLNHVRRIAFNIKDRLSTDTWQILTNLHSISLEESSGLPGILHERSIETLEKTLDWLSAFSGKTAENMVRTLGWQFLMIGKRIERSYNLIELLRHSLRENPEMEERHLRLLLNYADSIISYRNKHLNYFEYRPVFALILKDSNNPRTLSFNIERIIEHMSKIPWKTTSGDSHNEASQRITLELLEKTSRLDPETLFSGDPETVFQAFEDTLNELHHHIEQRFFAHI